MEIASCLITNIEQSTQEVTIWSHNCPCQDRDINAILAYIALIPTLKVINHKYLLRGHTHREGKKKMPKFQIMTPWDWQQLVRLASTRFTVVNMDITDFKDFLSLINCTNAPLIQRKNMKTEKNSKFHRWFTCKFGLNNQAKFSARLLLAKKILMS